MSLVMETHDLSHRFDRFVAVRSLDLRVETGAIYGFLGPNGSGKTTTIRILLGLLRPQTGRVVVLGQALPANRKVIARSVGSMVETPSLYDHLSAFDNIDMTRRALGLKPAETWRVLELVELHGFARQRAGGYSLGMRQRLGIARALLGTPRLLILDEPTNGLDPAGVMDMRRLIRELPDRQGVSVFVSSHMLNEIEQIATHVGLMDKGKLIAQSTLGELLASIPTHIEIGVRDAERAASFLLAVNYDAIIQADQRLKVMSGGDPAQINSRLVQSGFDVFALAMRSPSLEDVFVHKTSALAA
jgi:lantibiotic transport system ATP-binding protein